MIRKIEQNQRLINFKAGVAQGRPLLRGVSSSAKPNGLAGNTHAVTTVVAGAKDLIRHLRQQGAPGDQIEQANEALRILQKHLMGIVDVLSKPKTT